MVFSLITTLVFFIFVKCKTNHFYLDKKGKTKLPVYKYKAIFYRLRTYNT